MNIFRMYIFVTLTLFFQSTYADMQSHFKLVQGHLTTIGYDPGPVDGVLGHKTQQAIRHFQLDAGLPAREVKKDSGMNREEIMELFQQVIKHNTRQRQSKKTQQTTEYLNTLDWYNRVLSKDAILLKFSGKIDTHILQFDKDRISRSGLPNGTIYAIVSKTGLSGNEKLYPFKYGSWYIDGNKLNPELLCMKTSKFRSCFKIRKVANRTELVKFWHSTVNEKKYLPWNKKPLNQFHSYFTKVASLSKLDIKARYEKNKRRSDNMNLLGIALSAFASAGTGGADSGCDQGQIRDSVNGGFCPGKEPTPGSDY